MAKLSQNLTSDLLATLSSIDLENVSDPRKDKNKKWSISSILSTVMLAIATGQRNLRDTEFLSETLGKRVPATTLREALVTLDPHDIRRLLHQQCRETLKSQRVENGKFPFGVVSIDGKTTTIKQKRGNYAQSRTGPGKNRGFVRTLTCALISSESALCLDANPIPAQTNEMGHFQETVSGLLKAYGSLNAFQLIRADAGLNSQSNCEFLVNCGLHYCLALKGQQRKLCKAAKDCLGEIEEQLSEASEIEKLSKSKFIVRQLFITEELSGTAYNSTVRTVLRIQRLIIDHDKSQTHKENCYFISDLPASALTSKQWLALVRDHWRIENNVHNTLDTVFEEDERPWITQSETGFLVVSNLRRLVYNVLSLRRVKECTKTLTTKLKVAWKRLVSSCLAGLYKLVNSIKNESVKEDIQEITL